MPVDEFSIDGKPVSELRVVDLKELLEKRGLSKSGSKQVLIARLKENMLAEEKDEPLSDSVEELMPENEGRVPNMEMKSCGSNIVAQYLEKQQQALLAAKKAAMQTRATDARHSSNSSSQEESSTIGLVSNGSEKVDTQTSVSLSKKSENPVEREEKSEMVIEEQEKTERVVEEVEKTVLVEEKIVVEEKESQDATQIPENVALKSTDEGTKDNNENKNQEEQDPEEPAAESMLDNKRPLANKEDDIDQESQENSELISNHSPLEWKEDYVVEKEDQNADVATSDSEKADEVESGSEHSPEQEQMDEQSLERENTITDAATSTKDAKSNNIPETEPATERPVRKRRWGSTTVGKRATVSISSDSLKDIVGEVKTVDVAMLETQVEEQEEQLDYDDEPIPKRIVVPREDGENEEAATEATEKATTTMTRAMDDDSSTAIQRAKKIQMDEPEVTELFGEECIRVRPASPARRPIDRIIHVHGLTRPFNYKSWLSFLSSFGKFDVQNDFWIDNIKSHCLVRYATTEEATTARQQLDNIKWPKFNSSVLRVEYAGEDDLNRFKRMKEEDNRSSARSVNGNSQMADIQVRQRQVREITTTNDKENNGRRLERSPKREDQADNKLWPKSREWDRGKGEWKSGEHSPPPPSNMDRRERSSRTETSPFPKKAEVREKAAPAKLLEDLFRKTKTAPFIYWLPLSQEQINEKQQQKLRRDRERSEERRRRPSPLADRRPRDDIGSRYDRQRRR